MAVSGSMVWGPYPADWVSVGFHAFLSAICVVLYSLQLLGAVGWAKACLAPSRLDEGGGSTVPGVLLSSRRWWPPPCVTRQGQKVVCLAAVTLLASPCASTHLAWFSALDLLLLLVQFITQEVGPIVFCCHTHPQ
jgi:hypothetical protein